MTRMRRKMIPWLLVLSAGLWDAVPLAAQSDECADHDTSCTAVDGTARNRWTAYALDMLGPGALLGNAASAGMNHLFDEPDRWDGKWDGYGRRLASTAGEHGVRVSVEHGLAALLDRPTEYRRCARCESTGEHVRYALYATLFDPTPDGGMALAVPRIAGTYAGALAQAKWTPETDAGDALISGTVSILTSAIPNLARELLGIGR